jgi:uncharacterized membrane protein
VVVNFIIMSLKILIPFVALFIYKRTVNLIKAIRSKKKDLIKFELVLFFSVLIASILLISYSVSRIE